MSNPPINLANDTSFTAIRLSKAFLAKVCFTPSYLVKSDILRVYNSAMVETFLLSNNGFNISFSEKYLIFNFLIHFTRRWYNLFGHVSFGQYNLVPSFVSFVLHTSHTVGRIISFESGGVLMTLSIFGIISPRLLMNTSEPIFSFRSLIKLGFAKLALDTVVPINLTDSTIATGV